jgi:basic amino acid/polyamine antiporter, APA family
LEKPASDLRRIGLATAVAIIIANMIGTGVFTSLGFQVTGIKSVSALLMLWLTGGLVALCGALCYAELAVRFPGSGGEYHYLSKVYHPALGFLSGWISATVGFAAPIGLSAMAFGKYLAKLFPVLSGYDMQVACLLIIVVQSVNLIGVKTTSGLQRITTYTNLGLILLLIVSGIFTAQSSHFHFTLRAADWQSLISPAFAVSLIYVSFAYSGWNSITYIAGTIKDPQKNIPQSLFGAATLVMILYVLLNLTFLLAVPLGKLEGQLEVGFIAAEALFGNVGGKLIALMIGLALFASVNAMTIAGPGVTNQIGEDFAFFKFFSAKTSTGVPVISIIIQSNIALLLVLTSQFEKVLLYIGFTLTFFTTLTVLGLLIVRFREPPKAGLYRSPLFPLPALAFIALESYSMYWSLTQRTNESLLGVATVLVGLVVYFLAKREGKLKKWEG